MQEIFKARREQFKIKSHKDGYAPEWKASIYAGYIFCPYCKSNYRIKQHRYNGIVDHTYLTCSSNQNTKRCKNGNIHTDIFNQALLKQLSILRDNLMPLKSALIQAFTSPEAINQKSEIDATQAQITALRLKLEKLNGMHDEYAEALKEEISDEIIEKTRIKMRMQTDLIASDSAEYRASRIITLLRKLPSKIDTIEDINFKEIISRVIVKSRDHIWFVIGNNDVEKVSLKSKSIFNSKIEYTVRKTKNELNFGIIINR